MATETSLVSRVAFHATAESALPTLPAAGSNITTADWGTAGFDTVGSRSLRSDDYDADENTWSFEVEERVHRVKAPISDGTDDFILLGRVFNDFEITFYDMDQALLAFGSDIDVTTDITSWTDSMTPRTVAIELNKQGIFVFPKTLVRFNNFEMGMVEDQVARSTATFTPLSTATYAGGWYYEQY